jgi:hypothetical protein
MPKPTKWYLFHLGLRTKILYEFLVYSMRATSPAHLTLLDFIILLLFNEDYKL